MRKIIFNLIISLSIFNNSFCQNFCDQWCCNEASTSYNKSGGWPCFNNFDYKLVFHDEFDGTIIDKDMWTVLDGLPALNNEPQYYSPNNVTLENGNLKISTRHETLTAKSGSVDGWIPWGPRDFNSTSGWLKSKYRMPYDFGRIEARIKINNSDGVRPAFWLYNGSTWNEIDIFEFDGKKNMGSVVLYDRDNDEYGVGQCQKNMNNYLESKGILNAFDGSDDFHIYACEWNPSTINIYVDGELFWRYNRFFDLDGAFLQCPYDNSYFIQRKFFPRKSMEIKLNVHVKDVNKMTNSEMLVDYVRVYYRAPCNQDIVIDNPSQIPNIEGEYNFIIGKTVKINCSYNMSAKQSLKIVALEKIELGPNFTMTQGAYLEQEIIPNLCENPLAFIKSMTDENFDLSKVEFQDIRLEVYPNPANKKINIKPNKPLNGSFEIMIFNINGKLIKSLNIENLSDDISIEDLDKGFYTITIKKDNFNFKSIKLSVI